MSNLSNFVFVLDAKKLWLTGILMLSLLFGGVVTALKNSDRALPYTQKQGIRSH